MFFCTYGMFDMHLIHTRMLKRSSINSTVLLNSLAYYVVNPDSRPSQA